MPGRAFAAEAGAVASQRNEEAAGRAEDAARHVTAGISHTSSITCAQCGVVLFLNCQLLITCSNCTLTFVAVAGHCMVAFSLLFALLHSCLRVVGARTVQGMSGRNSAARGACSYGPGAELHVICFL